DAVIAVRHAGEIFPAEIAAREIHDVAAAEPVHARPADAVLGAARQQTDLVLVRDDGEIVRLHAADVIARKRLAADAFPVVTGGIPEAPAAVFADHRMHGSNRAAAGPAIQDRGFLHALEMIAAIGG